jgi:hypothetical protein
MTPRKTIVGLALIIALIVTTYHCRQMYQSSVRAARYQTVLKTYKEQIKPGMARQEVNDILRNKKIVPSHEPYGGPPLDDFIYIGRERDLWYCSWENVDIQLKYTASTSNVTVPALSDILSSIALSRWPHDCM